MALIPKTNIATGNTILASDITNIINSLNETGSYTVIATGSFTGSFTGLADSASYALSSSYSRSGSYAVSASYALSSSYALSGSYAVSASYALSGSFSSTASLAQNILFTNISSVPAGLASSNGWGGSSAVNSTYTGPTNFSISALSEGKFVPLDATGGSINIDVNTPPVVLAGVPFCVGISPF